MLEKTPWWFEVRARCSIRHERHSSHLAPHLIFPFSCRNLLQVTHPKPCKLSGSHSYSLVGAFVVSEQVGSQTPLQLRGLSQVNSPPLKDESCGNVRASRNRRYFRKKILVVTSPPREKKISGALSLGADPRYPVDSHAHSGNGCVSCARLSCPSAPRYAPRVFELN